MFQVYMLYISSLFSHIYKEYVLYCIYVDLLWWKGQFSL